MHLLYQPLSLFSLVFLQRLRDCHDNLVSAMARVLCTCLRAVIFFPVCLRLSVHLSSCFCHNPLEYSLLLPSIPGLETLSCDEMHESQKEIMCRAFINNLVWVAKETKMCRELSYKADGSL